MPTSLEVKYGVYGHPPNFDKEIAMLLRIGMCYMIKKTQEKDSRMPIEYDNDNCNMHRN